MLIVQRVINILNDVYLEYLLFASVRLTPSQELVRSRSRRWLYSSKTMQHKTKIYASENITHSFFFFLFAP